MNYKNSICLVVVTFCCLNINCAQNAIKIPRNEYGVRVISDVKTFNKTVLLDTNKKMVLLQDFITPLIIDWKYATENNFTREVLYSRPHALLRLPAAKALQQVQQELKEKGLSLKFFDAYRPYSVTKKMWKAVPDEKYAANPAKGSGHNRGAAIDVTLVNLNTTAELQMPTAFDDFTIKAHHNCTQLDTAAISNRRTLRTVMEKYGFVVLETEWWHYALPDAANKFELLDIDFTDFANGKEVK